MTTTPDGTLTTAAARLAEIVERYGRDSQVGRFTVRSRPEIFRAVAQTEALAADRG
jgi:hypothetical protein